MVGAPIPRMGCLGYRPMIPPSQSAGQDLPHGGGMRRTATSWAGRDDVVSRPDARLHQRQRLTLEAIIAAPLGAPASRRCRPVPQLRNAPWTGRCTSGAGSARAARRGDDEARRAHQPASPSRQRPWAEAHPAARPRVRRAAAYGCSSGATQPRFAPAGSRSPRSRSLLGRQAAISACRR